LALRQASALVEAMAADDLEQYEQKHRELSKGARRMGNLMLWLDRNPRLRRRVIRAWESKHRSSFAHVGNACGARNSGGSVFDMSATRLAAADYLTKESRSPIGAAPRAAILTSRSPIPLIIRSVHGVRMQYLRALGWCYWE
jgi:hypothetical protein